MVSRSLPVNAKAKATAQKCIEILITTLAMHLKIALHIPWKTKHQAVTVSGDPNRRRRSWIDG